MTIKELKKVLDNLPEDATAYFSLWTSKGEKRYWFNHTFGNKVSKNGKYAQIAFTDNCPMYTLNEEELIN